MADDKIPPLVLAAALELVAALDRAERGEFSPPTSRRPRAPYVQRRRCTRCEQRFIVTVLGPGPPQRICTPCQPLAKRAATAERVRRHRAKAKRSR